MSKWLKLGGIAAAIIVGVAALGIAAFSFMPRPVSAQIQANLGRTGFGPRMDRPAEMRFDDFGPAQGLDEFRGPFGEAIDYQALLAEALGISVNELQAAQDQARTKAVEQAVAEGLITQEQADMALARIQLRPYLDRDQLMAEALGITVEEIQAARDEGKPIAVLIYELGLQPATVRTNMATAFENAIQQAVSDGVITQEQADQINSGPKAGFGGPGGRLGPGGHGGFGGFRGF